jgi:uncharacterized protein
MPKSSSSYLFPDINVWVALSYERHIHHSAARRWFDQCDANVLICFCRFTQLGFLRLLTTNAVMGQDGVLSQADAWRLYDRWYEDGRILFLEEPVLLEPQFRILTQDVRPAPKDWADAYLAAFATATGLRLVTFDISFGTKLREVDLLL